MSSSPWATSNRQRLLALAGTIAPPLFAALVIVLGYLKPGYNHTTDMISILGGVGGIRGSVFNSGLALTGTLLVTFAVGLHRGIGGGEGSKAGPILIGLGGIGLVGSAHFHCNTGCTNILKSPTFTGALHSITSFMTGACLALAPLVTAGRLRKDPRWKRYTWFTMAMGILANIPGLILWISFFTTRMPAGEGLIQRLGIIFPLLWVEVIALQLWRRSNSNMR